VRIVGVIDLKDGRAVHARGGDRDRYEPVSAVSGDAVALADFYRARGVAEIYVADLDAIAGQKSQDDIVDALIGCGLPLWLDAGITTWQRAQETINRGAARVVIGLETLSSFEALDVICISVGGERVAFSLDLRGGKPIAASRFGLDAGRLPAASTVPGERLAAPVSAGDIAARAAQAGIGAMIVLDLARVGNGSGPDFDLIAGIRAAAPAIMLLAGGGVRGDQDLERLTAVGCDGALVATALHQGRLSRV
jgi:phosphoribosylformimino-5-aminoimidazole carboxamide ribotide isomerase